MRLPNLLLKFQRCPARTTVTELQNTKASKITRPNLSWVLGGLRGNLHLCPRGKDINLAKGGLQSMSVLSPEDGCEVEGAACAPATFPQSCVERATKFALKCLQCNLH